MSCLQPQPNTTHTCTHIHTHIHTHIQSYTSTINPQAQHTIRTQNAHNFHTIRTHSTENNNMQHIQENREQHTEHSTISVHNLSTQNSAHNYRTYSFDFYHLQQYIKKLYNTAIYEYYTFWSPYWWGEQITITLIYWRYYIKNSYIMILINLISYYSTNNKIDTLKKHYM